MNPPEGKYETVTKAAVGEGKFIREADGQGQYGHVSLKIEPGKAKGVTVLNEVVGNAIPKEYIKPVTDGIMEGLRHGVIAGYPVVGVIVRIVDGSSHAKYSSELAFKMAGLFALKDAMKKGDPVLLG